MKLIIRKYEKLDNTVYWKLETDSGTKLESGKAVSVEDAITQAQDFSERHACITPLQPTVTEYQIDMI